MIYDGPTLRDSLEQLSSAEKIADVRSGVYEVIGADTLVFVPAEAPRTQSVSELLADAERSAGQFEHVLVITDSCAADLARTPVEWFAGSFSPTDPETLGSEVNAILQGTKRSVNLFDDAENEIDHSELKRVGLLPYTTPTAIQTSLVQWTLSGGRRTVLDAGCGTGGLLETARDHLGVDGGGEMEADNRSSADALWGVDTSPIACQLTKSRLGEAATVLRTDYLRLGQDAHASGSSQRQLDDWASVSKLARPSNVELPQFDAILCHPPNVRLSTLQPEQREFIANTFECQRPHQVFVLHSLALLCDGGRVGALVPEASLTTRFLAAIHS